MIINNTQNQKLLGAHIDFKLKFDTNIETLCKKVSCPCPSDKVNVYKSSTILNEMF